MGRCANESERFSLALSLFERCSGARYLNLRLRSVTTCPTTDSRIGAGAGVAKEGRWWSGAHVAKKFPLTAPILFPLTVGLSIVPHVAAENVRLRAASWCDQGLLSADGVLATGATQLCYISNKQTKEGQRLIAAASATRIPTCDQSCLVRQSRHTNVVLSLT